MWKYNIAIVASLMLVACNQQSPVPVVAATPNIQKRSNLAGNPASPNLKSIWSWPAHGRGTLALKGMDIEGQEGAAINAARDGEVVYSGNSLQGYGNLIIIKHDKNFITAYAHNRRNMVKEGEKVLAGQRIAEMGKTGTDKVKLHFEVRHQGNPIDPRKVLPAR